jgi:hypothetical protein
MIDPVDAQQIATAAILAGAIVFFGTVYAVFYALAMLSRSRRLLRFAYAGYLCLFAATIALAVVLQLYGWWLSIVVALTLGYFIAPRLIWRLSVAVHEEEPVDHLQVQAEREMKYAQDAAVSDSVDPINPINPLAPKGVQPL